MNFSPVALILAAGEASRFGSPKQIAELNGKTLVGHAIDNIRQSGCSEVYVVTGAWRERVGAALHHLPATELYHADWAAGQQSSVRFGLRKLLEQPGWNYLHLFTADMPWYTGEYFTLVSKVAMLDAARETLVATHYPDTYQKQGPGLPLLLPRIFVENYLKRIGENPELSLRRAVMKYVPLKVFPAGPHTKDVDRPVDLMG